MQYVWSTYLTRHLCCHNLLVDIDYDDKDIKYQLIANVLSTKSVIVSRLIDLQVLDNSYIRFGTKLSRQIVGIPMGTNCAPLVADLFFILL